MPPIEDTTDDENEEAKAVPGPDASREHAEAASADGAPLRPADLSLEQTRRRLETREQRLAELERDVRALSHGIRSPLVALKGFSGLLAEEHAEALGESGRHFLQRIEEASRRIESRLNDFAQLLAIDEESPSRSWTDPTPLIESLASSFKGALDEAGMRILMSNDPPLVYCDQRQLEVALTHLIGNALQHGVPAEPRHVQIRITGDDAATTISVTDDGPGMEEAMAERAFEPFDAAGEQRRRFDDGRESTGIGLALVRRIADAHGGEARFETAPGRGMTVTLTFPHPSAPDA